MRNPDPQHLAGLLTDNDGLHEHHAARQQHDVIIGLTVTAVVALILFLVVTTRPGHNTPTIGPLVPAIHRYQPGTAATTGHTHNTSGSRYGGPSGQLNHPPLIAPEIEAAEAERLAEIWAGATPGQADR